MRLTSRRLNQHSLRRSMEVSSAATQLLRGHGYIWIPQGYAQQNAVTGLPLQLWPEELQLARDKGWVRPLNIQDQAETAARWEVIALHRDAARKQRHAEEAAAEAVTAEAAAAGITERGMSADQSAGKRERSSPQQGAEGLAVKKPRLQTDIQQATDATVRTEPADRTEAGLKRKHVAAADQQPEQPQQTPQGHTAGVGAGSAAWSRAAAAEELEAAGPASEVRPDQAGQEQPRQVEQGAAADGGQGVARLPSAAADATAERLQQAEVNVVAAEETADAAEAETAPTPWIKALLQKQPVPVPVYPDPSSPALSTCAEQPDLSGGADAADSDSQPHADCAAARAATFRDIHDKRYCLTSGSKFGADYLVYPGDPMLFHAQFCAHLVDADERLRGCLLSGSARGSHSARKHLLYVVRSKDGALRFLSLAPEAGFGTAHSEAPGAGEAMHGAN